MLVGMLSIPFSLITAFNALLAYCVFSFMKPQSFAYFDTVRNARFTLAVAIVLILRTMTTVGTKIRLKSPTVFFIFFWAWMGLTTLTAVHPFLSEPFLLKFSKIALPMLLLTGLVHTRQQLKYLVVLLAMCPGVYGLRLGLWFVTHGTITHQGGPLGMDNNDLALFLDMGVPMLVFAAAEVQQKWLRWLLIAMAILSVPAVIIGESRGGMVGMVAAGVITLWRRTNWRKFVILMVIGIPIVLAIIPPHVQSRYLSIQHYQQDSSAQGRLHAWDTARRMAAAHPWVGIGIGTESFLAEYDIYKRDAADIPRVAHSVWYSTLAGMGYPGLVLFVALIGATFLTTRRIRRLAKTSLGGPASWAYRYAVMIECTVVAFCVAATFLSQVGFEYVYSIFLLSVPLHAIAAEEAARAPGESLVARPQVEDPSLPVLE